MVEQLYYAGGLGMVAIGSGRHDAVDVIANILRSSNVQRLSVLTW
jgi:aconitase A